MHCEISSSRNNGGEALSDGVLVHKCNQFKYLGSIIQKKEVSEEDIIHNINHRWMKWKSGACIMQS